MLPPAADPSSPLVRQSIDLRRFSWIRRLATDYAFEFPRLARFFAGNPTDLSAWRRAIDLTLAHERQRERMAEIVRRQQLQRGAPSQALMASDRLRDPATVAVVTGQQAGLFGGPLFTLLKALTALKLAEAVTRDHSVPAVAVFWIDAEDHDWDEVRTCRVLDPDHNVQSLGLGNPAGAGEMPVARIRLDESITAATDALAAALPRTEFTRDLIDQLGRAYRPGVGMVDAFGQWMETVLGSRGLILFDASDPDAKPLARPIFIGELRSPGRTAELALKAGRDLETNGYHAQVVPQPESVALFHLDGSREPIRRRGPDLTIGERASTPAALLNQLAADPQHFSPNVLLRPLVQDSLFPTICYVAGPNELAYLAQLREVYEQFGVPMPLMYPRASATILDSGAARFLSRYEVPFETLQPQDDSALNRLLESQLPRFVEEALQEAIRTVEVRMNEVSEAVKLIDSTLEGAARSTLGRMQHDLQTLHSKIIQAAKRKDETLRRQFARTRDQAFPEGHAQERVLGFVQFLNRYGPAFLDRLEAELPLDLGQHWIITI